MIVAATELLEKHDATAAVALVKSGALLPSDLVAASLARIRSMDESVHAFAHTDDALVESAAQRMRGDFSAFAIPGIPIGVKDIFNTYDFRTEMGSPIWQGFTPGNDARPVAALRQEGGIVVGKTVTAEFAVHTPGPTLHPMDPRRSPGTSSSGSAVAVATRMVPLALGTQTAGSIIRPASYCGVFGFKPSFGLVPRTGVLKTTDTLDTVGGFANSVRDIRLLFDVIRVQGRDYPIAERRMASAAVPERIRVAVVKGPKWDFAEGYAQEALMAAADRLASRSDMDVRRVELPESFSDAHSVHDVIYCRALAYYFRGEYQAKTLVSPLLNSMIARGLDISVDEYTEAVNRQTALSAELDEWLVSNEIDAIVTLSTGGEAPLHEEADRPDTCLVWTLCGAPALSLPLFTGPTGLPFGLQVVGRRFYDHPLLEVAESLFEKLRG